MNTSSKDVVEKVSKLGFVWDTIDPFLFCVHHLDDYPAGNDQMAPPRSSLQGRNIGNDFVVKDGFRMYHGDAVPGFPRHPHRGFETVTLVRKGYIDHSDSLGATARFGEGGDCQWMTAGKGIEHSEMFPLRDSQARNPLELFQIWLNLPASSKFVPPHFTMLWAEKIPRHTFKDANGRNTTVVTVAGALEPSPPLAPPPPHSWAARPDSHVAIWTIKMEPNATWTVPAASPEANRMLFFHVGDSITVGSRQISASSAIRVRAGVPVDLVNGPMEGELLMLQGKPIGEPVAQQGPFVMNSMSEIRDAFIEYRSGAFGKWPFQSDGPVHAREKGRFAIHADGREEHM